MEYSSDRDALLDYYKHLLVNNEISACKKRKLSDSDSGTNGLISAETRNGESCKWKCKMFPILYICYTSLHVIDSTTSAHYML